MLQRYIVVESDLFVAQDLCDILSNCVRTSEIVPVADVAGAVHELRRGAGVEMVFLNGVNARMTDPECLDLVDAHAATLVRIGAKAQEGARAEREISIRAPFTNDAIMAVVSSPSRSLG